MSIVMNKMPLDICDSLPKRFERKFYITTQQVGFACGLLRQVCAADRDFPAEQINSLYFDTLDLDQYERSDSGDLRKDKIRIRWYGREYDLAGLQTIYIELKSREGFAGMKQRRKLHMDARSLKTVHLGSGILPYHQLVETLAAFGYVPPGILRPIIKISYWRYRFRDLMSGQRASLDCRIRSTMVLSGWGNGERDLELPGAVLEIKGDKMELPPTLMKTAILDTDWTRFSKYSACIESHRELPGSVGRLSPIGRVVR